jgi:hypothetical protein
MRSIFRKPTTILPYLETDIYLCSIMHIPLYTERQKFDKFLTWVIIIVNVPIMVVVLAVGYFEKFKTSASVNFHPMSGLELAIFTVIMLTLCIGTSLIFVISKLETEILQTGIRYRLFPFQIRFRYIPWEDVTRAYVRKYKPLGEFGGFGLRYSTKNGRAVNVSGDMGIQLELKTGKKLLIGTCHPEEVEKFLIRVAPQAQNN